MTTKNMLKHFPKIITIFFLVVFILQLTCLLFLTLTPNASQAADPATFKPQVDITGMQQEFGAVDSKTGGYAIPGSTASIAKYVRVIYKYAIGIVGILAAVVLMVGGVMWIIAGGNSTAIGEAKSWIGASLTGLLLALLSYLILATVNPALVDFQVTAIERPTQIGETATFDSSTPCGQQLPGEKLICGSYCPATGQKCEKVPGGTAGAKDCMVGGDDWWLCSSLSGGGTNCCDSNNDIQCPSGYICNMQMVTSSCMGKGTCALKQSLNGICGENNDCANNNCDTGFLATHRCK